MSILYGNSLKETQEANARKRIARVMYKYMTKVQEKVNKRNCCKPEILSDKVDDSFVEPQKIRNYDIMN